MNPKYNSLLKIHISVLLFGLSGLFAKFLSLPPLIIVLGRVIFSSIFLFSLITALKIKIELRHPKHYFLMGSMGIILAVHWVTFFSAIQISTVAIGLLTFSTFPVFVTFLEPYFFNEGFKFSNLLIASATLAGILLIVPNFELSNQAFQGALWGILSGFTYALLAVLNRKYVKEYSSFTIAFYEQVVAAAVLIPFALINPPTLHTQDILLLLLLGTLFTGVSHTLFIQGLKHTKAHTAGIVSTLEPVYGILFAALLLKEFPGIKELMGGAIILGTVLYSTLKKD